MHYPLWDVPGLGGGLVIAGIAIFHVVIAHFAVGAGILNVLTERRARKTGDSLLLSFVRDNSNFLIYLAFVAGALSGVGIWFSIGLDSPEGTTFLIRLFLWVWAMEWVFFLVELASGYVYYYTWDRISARAHVAVGWIYAASAFMSLVMINGILTFMLTPGAWLQTGSLWDAWYNPSFLPSLCIRVVSSLALAGIFVTMVATRKKKYERADRERLVAWAAHFMLPLGLMPVFAIWYFDRVPAAARDLALGGAFAMTAMFAFGVVTSFLVGVYAFFGMLRKARDINFETAALMATIAIIATASMEFVREGIRKPYLITDVMYANGILVAEKDRFQTEGLLAQSAWIQPDTVHFKGTVAEGEAVYRAQCLRCHQVTGYNGMVPLIKDWNRALVTTTLDHLDQIKGFMPPFIGTDPEKHALANYLMTLTKTGLDSANVKSEDTSKAVVE
jgi:cytochrome bd-type quinol oxidase subunit 1